VPCAPQDVSGEPAAFGADRLEEVDRFDLAIAGPTLCEFYDLSDARCHQDPLPHPIFTGTERTLNLRMNSSLWDPLRRESRIDVTVVLLEQRIQQVLGTHVVVIVVPALLLRCSEHASGGWAET
jgi:hypothetical protein